MEIGHSGRSLSFYRQSTRPAILVVAAILAVVGCNNDDVLTPDNVLLQHEGAESEATYVPSQEMAMEDGLRFKRSASEWLANGTHMRQRATRHPWPVDVLSIGHSIGSYQNYGDTPYFHHGLDIRAEAGSDVRASAGGRVVNIENYVPPHKAYWEVAILDDEGFLWQYHHIDPSSIPASLFEAWETGRPIEAGTKLGTVQYWAVSSYGERFHHIHLNILGAGRRYLNGFGFLEVLPDRAAPKIVEIGLLKDGQRHHSNNVRGAYGLFAIVHDLVLHDKFVVPPQELRARVDGGVEETIWAFHDLPGKSSISQYVQDFYVPSLTCGNYHCRKLAINLSFDQRHLRQLPELSGVHKIELTAVDDVGNETTSEFTWLVD